MFFSVIIPTYNSSETIYNTIKSVLVQSFQDFEIIIIDDCSDDLEIAKRIVQDFSDERITFMALKKKGNASVSRNIGIKKAHGEFIAFLDSDDEWISNKLETYNDAFEKLNENEKNTTVLFSKAYIYNSRNHRLINPKRGLEKNETLSSYKIYKGGSIYTPTIALSRKLALTSFFDEELSIHEDFAFCLNLSLLGTKFTFIPLPLTIVYWNRGVTERIQRSTWKKSYKFHLKYKKKLSPEEDKMFLLRNVAYRLLLVGNYKGFIYMIKRLSLLKVFFLDLRAFSKILVKSIV